jgi:tape measure domain-containing protein
MADVTVEFGATDTGLEKTLKAVQDELTQLKGKVSSGELSMTELESTMKRIGQVTSMEKNIKAIGDQSDGTSKDVNEMGKAMEETGKKGEIGFGKIVSAAALAGGAVKLGMMAVDAAFAAVSGAFEAFGESINKAADFQQLETSFNVLIGNTTLARTFLEDLSKFAASTPFTIPGLADASKTLLAFGVMSSEVIPIVSMLGDVAQGNEEKLKSLALAFGKVESQGKLTGEELNQMIDSGFNPLEHISEKTGKSMGELRKEMEKGSITSAMIREAFVAATSEGGKFFEMTKKQGLTFNGVMSTMQDAVDDLYRRFGKPVIEALTPIIQKWSERIAEIAPLFDLIGQAVGNTITYFSDLIDKVFNVEKAVGNIGSSISAISGGEYAAGIENLFLSMKVWAMETGNEIYKYLGAAFTTAADFLVTTLGPSSAGFALLETGFSILAGKVKVELLAGIAAAMEGMGPLFANGAKTAKYQMETAAKSVEVLTFGLGAQVELVQEQMTEAGAALPKSFSENYKEIPPLFNDIKSTQDQIDANNAKIAASTKTIVLTDEEAVAEAKAYFDQWKKSEDLKKKASEKAAEDLKIEQDKIAAKKDELKFQLAIAEAQAAGDTERVTALQTSKKYAEDVQKALAAGFDKEEAATFATNMAIAAANSANIKQYDKDGNQLFYKAAEMSAKLNENLKSATGFADTLANMKEIEALNKAANSSKAMKNELKAMDELLGTTFAQKSEYDLVKLLNIKDIGPTQQDQIRAIVTYFKGVRDQLSANPIDSAKGQEEIKKIIKFLGGNPLTADLVVKYQKAQADTKSAFGSIPTTLDADKSVKGLRDSVKDGIELDVAAKSGATGLLDAIKTAVEAIKTAVEKIEPKLPMAVVGA